MHTHQAGGKKRRKERRRIFNKAAGRWMWDVETDPLALRSSHRHRDEDTHAHSTLAVGEKEMGIY